MRSLKFCSTLHMHLFFLVLAIGDIEGVERNVTFSPNQRDIVVAIPFQERVRQFDVILESSPDVFIDTPARAVVIVSEMQGMFTLKIFKSCAYLQLHTIHNSTHHWELQWRVE